MMKFIRSKRSLALTLVILLFLCISIVSCSKRSPIEEAKRFIDEGKYRDAIFVIKHYFKRGGEKNPELLYLAGISYLKLGIESDASESFEECISKDKSWAEKIADIYSREVLIAMGKQKLSKAKRLIAEAIHFRPGVDFGRYNVIAGNVLMEQRVDSLAIVYFERYMQEYPDTSGISRVMLNLATCYESMGDTTKALEMCRTIISKFPKSQVKSSAEWKLENLLYKKALGAFYAEQADEARLMLEEIITSSHNPVIKEKAYFLLGRIYESLGDVSGAVRYYREVVNLNLGSSSRLLEKAKERIEKLEASKN